MNKELTHISSAIMNSIRALLISDAYIELFPPTIAPQKSGLFYPAFDVSVNGLSLGILSVGSTLAHAKAAAFGVGKTFSVTSNFRADDISDQNKLWEFRNIEIWCAGTLENAIDFVEQIYAHALHSISALVPRSSRLLSEPKYQLSHSEAHKMLGTSSDKDFDLSEKLRLVDTLGGRVYLTKIPAQVNPHNIFLVAQSGHVECFDLLGSIAGEIAIAGILETEPRRLKDQLSGSRVEEILAAEGIGLDFFQQYFDAISALSRPVIRINIGFERLCQHLIGVSSIENATAFPVMPGYFETAGAGSSLG